MYRRSLSKSHIALVSLSVFMFLTGCTTSLGTSNNKSSDQWNKVIEGLPITASFTKVNVSVDVFSLRFESASEQSAHISLNSSEPEDIKKYFDLNISEKNDQLDIKIKKKNNNKMSLSELNTLRKAELVVQLPANDYTKVDIISDVGTIHYEQIDAEQLTVSTEVGNMTIKDTNTSQMDITSSAGSIKLYDTSGTMDIQNNVGTVHLNVHSLEDDIHIKTDVGNVTVEAETPPEQFSIDLATELGKVTSNWGGSFDEQSARTIKAQAGNNGPHIKVRSSVGNIVLQ